ncbi:MAG: T9SS type A sorting domain-containing protein [Cytophagaceae bacterium]|nr:T9SS type A sorting domain-containing protein [Cytophagaceae bacterium]
MKKRYTLFTSNFISMFFSISCAFLTVSTCLGAAYNVNINTDIGAGAGLTGDLRYCITQANAIAGPHTIVFTTGATTITLGSALPVIVRQISITATVGTIVINGNAAVNNIFQINTAGANSIIDGLVLNRAVVAQINLQTVTGVTILNCYLGTNNAGNTIATSNPQFGINMDFSSNNFITNNVISGNSIHGILVNNTSNTNTIRGNKIGCNLLGTGSIPNSVHGIEINNNSINNIIGGAALADRNIISGNTVIGLSIVGASNGTQIINNYIGINLAGTAALSNGLSGISITNSPPSAITNNVVSGNNFHGIELNSSATTITGNKVGVNAAGTAIVANTQMGIRVNASPNTIIGGSALGQANTVSGSGQDGIRIEGASDDVSILGNFIGTNSSGTAVIANALNGINIINSNRPIVGGVVAGESNVISGNGDVGLRFENSSNASVRGNFIGTNNSGTAVIPNNHGIYGGTSGGGATANVTIGGNTAAARNIISGNNIKGIYFQNGCNDLVIEGNYIGTDVNGVGSAAIFGNGDDGIFIFGSCLRPRIGGTTAGQRNVMSGNGRLWPSASTPNGTGINIQNGVNNAVITGNYIGIAADGTARGNKENGITLFNGCDNALIGGSTATTRNIVSNNPFQGINIQSCNAPVVIGNYCGTDIAGTGIMGNGSSGILLLFSTNAIIGTTATGEGNVLSNNGQLGLHIIGGFGHIVYNNMIGVANDGTTARGNKNGNVYILGLSGGGANAGSNNTIGGIGANQSNIIAYSTNTGSNGSFGNGFGIGVAAQDNTAGINNLFRGNKIFCNAGLGIDLNFATVFGGGNGIGNNSKTAPAITAVSSTSTTGSGTNGETIHVYSNVTCTTCQGETYLGSAVVAGGVWTVTHVSVAVPSNNSATATNGTQGTSQFTCNFVLPVELISFKAKALGNVALLNWSTAMEKNNAAFVIERSKDGKTFESIGNKAGQGTTLSVTNYEFADEHPYNTLVYYRLKQIDIDGTSTYSSIQAVYFESATDVYLFPNPATDELNIVLNSDELYDIHVYSNLGVEVQHLSTTKNNNTYTIQLTSLASGSYIIVLSSASKQITKQFLVY